MTEDTGVLFLLHSERPGWIFSHSLYASVSDFFVFFLILWPFWLPFLHFFFPLWSHSFSLFLLFLIIIRLVLSSTAALIFHFLPFPFWRHLLFTSFCLVPPHLAFCLFHIPMCKEDPFVRIVRSRAGVPEEPLGTLCLFKFCIPYIFLRNSISSPQSLRSLSACDKWLHRAHYTGLCVSLCVGAHTKKKKKKMQGHHSYSS